MKTVFLMIARVLYDKGYQEYVDAARIIHQEYTDVEFQLLGRIDEEYPNHVPEQIVLKDQSDGILHYLGFVSNVRPLIKAASCIVHPTFYNEGMSRVLMEAMAMEKPIITTNIPGCRETVEEGRNGYLVPPRDALALADALRRFLSLSEEERMEMGRYGRKKAEREFDVRNVIAIYRKITG
ncbi:MAG: glycosyltransferase [Bacteroidaceae bacterium]|jgi:glycosyltransferase involved in cell wall biosynthesis